MLPARRLPLLCVAVLCAAPAFAEGKGRVVMLDLQPLDPEVSEAVAGQVSAALRSQLGSSFTVVPASEIEELRAGTVKPPNISGPLQQLAEAKEKLASGDPKGALKLLKKVDDALDPLRPQLRDYSPVTSTLLYTAVAAMNAKQKKPSQAAFAELARLRPDYRINPAEFPPNVLDAFEKARTAEAKLPRGRIVISSAPAGARAFVDEVPVGNTPVAVPSAPGEHIVRVESDGYLGFTKRVTVESYAKVDAQATLEKNQSIDSLQKLEMLTITGGAPGTFAEPATTVATALRADAVVVGVIGLSVKGYMASVALLPAGAPVQVVLADFDRSLEKETDSLAALGKAVIDASRAHTQPRADAPRTATVVGGDAASRTVDFGKYELGIGPGGSAKVLADAAAAEKARIRAAAAASAAEVQQVAEKPASRWYLWVGAAVAVAAAGGGVAAYMLTRPPAGVQFEIERQR